MIKKILVSLGCGILILFINWLYQNYDFSLSAEDAFLKKIFLLKDKIHASTSHCDADILFINTGKDLALVDDSLDYGNVAVSNREKIYKLVHYIDTTAKKPRFTVLDIQFYYPYSVNPTIDSLMAVELNHNNKILIPVMSDHQGGYKKPLYGSSFAYAEYRTYGPLFNKFRILNQSKTLSIPVFTHQALNHVSYKDHFFYATMNGRLCLSSIWPSYYIKNSDVITETSQLSDTVRIKSQINHTTGQPKIKTGFFNIGEMLLDMEANPASYTDFFNDRLIIIGNFEEDIHATPVGKMFGSVLLANIYLSLLNGQHLVSLWFFLTLLIVFSLLSYLALFGKMPEIKFNFRFLFSSYLVKFIRSYVSYFGCLFLLSILVIFIFNVQVGLFLPSLMFTGVEYVRHKKYKAEEPR